VKVTTTPTSVHGVNIEYQWSSSAEEPRMWIRIEGGESIDPRDPKHLARLPITNSALINAHQARTAAAELLAWADELDAETDTNSDAYLGTD